MMELIDDVTPPRRVPEASPIAVVHQTFGSASASQTCGALTRGSPTPAMFFDVRHTATTFCSWVRNRAFAGWSGTHSRNRTPRREVQRAVDEEDELPGRQHGGVAHVADPVAGEGREHVEEGVAGEDEADAKGVSRRVNQRARMFMQRGAMPDSAMPRRKRRARRPAEWCTGACRQSSRLYRIK